MSDANTNTVAGAANASTDPSAILAQIQAKFDQLTKREAAIEASEAQWKKREEGYKTRIEQQQLEMEIAAMEMAEVKECEKEVEYQKKRAEKQANARLEEFDQLRKSDAALQEQERQSMLREIERERERAAEDLADQKQKMARDQQSTKEREAAVAAKEAELEKRLNEPVTSAEKLSARIAAVQAREVALAERENIFEEKMREKLDELEQRKEEVRKDADMREKELRKEVKKQNKALSKRSKLDEKLDSPIQLSTFSDPDWMVGTTKAQGIAGWKDSQDKINKDTSSDFVAADQVEAKVNQAMARMEKMVNKQTAGLQKQIDKLQQQRNREAVLRTIRSSAVSTIDDQTLDTLKVLSPTLRTITWAEFLHAMAALGLKSRYYDGDRNVHFYADADGPLSFLNRATESVIDCQYEWPGMSLEKAREVFEEIASDLGIDVDCFMVHEKQ